MPNWVDNILVIGHPDKEMQKRLLGAYRRGKLGQEFVPMPDEYLKDDRWHDWRNVNWGTKWDVTPYEWDRNGNSITLTFDSAWSPPVTLYETLTEEGWYVSAKYHEPGCVFIGKFEDGFDEYYEYDITDEDAINELPEELIEFGNLLEEHQNWKENNEDANETED